MYKIAVLDDDEHWCLAIQRFFRNDFEVSTFSYADSLLEEIVQDFQRFDLIMVDLSIPPDQFKDVDGRKLIRYLRESLPEPPVLVLVTAFLSKSDLETGEIKCEEADAFLAKDAGLDEILQRVKSLINSKLRARG